jgi:iron complex outermembrane recepter protein
LNVAAPEKVTSYEVGFKSEFLDRTLTVNGAAFYYDYKSQQALSIDPNTLAQTLINIPKSRIAGAELEVVARPVTNVRLNLGVGALNTRIQQGDINGVSIVGNRLPNAPNLTLTAGVDWDILDQDVGKVTAGFNANMNSKQYFELFNTNRIAQGEYALLTGRLAYRTHNDRFGVSLWGRNLAGKYYFRSSIDVSGFGFDFFHLGEPRTYGIMLDAKL